MKCPMISSCSVASMKCTDTNPDCCLHFDKDAVKVHTGEWTYKEWLENLRNKPTSRCTT